MAKVPVKIRQARESEHALVYKTWIDTFSESHFARVIKPTIYRDRQRKAIRGILDRSTTHLLVAVAPEDEDVVLAWAAVEAPDIAHYVFVKREFRRFGLGSELLKSLPPSFRHSHRTPWGEPFVRSFAGAVYDPYATYKLA